MRTTKVTFPTRPRTSARNRTELRRFGDDVAPCARWHSRLVGESNPSHSGDNRAATPVASRGMSLPAASRTRCERFRRAPPASGGTEKDRVVDGNRTRLARATTSRLHQTATTTTVRVAGIEPAPLRPERSGQPVPHTLEHRRRIERRSRGLQPRAITRLALGAFAPRAGVDPASPS